KYSVPRAVTLEFLTKAEALFADMARLGRSTSELRYRKGLMLLEFARNYAVLGDTNLQLARAEAAQDLIRTLAQEHPDDPRLQPALWRACTDVGDALVAQGETSKALGQHTEARLIAQRFTTTNATIGPWQGLSISSERIGDILMSQGKLSEAVNYYRELLDIGQRLSSQSRGDSGLVPSLAAARARGCRDLSTLA